MAASETTYKEEGGREAALFLCAGLKNYGVDGAGAAGAGAGAGAGAASAGAGAGAEVVCIT